MKAATKERKRKNVKQIWVSKAVIAGQVRTATYNKKLMQNEFKKYAEKIRIQKNMAAGGMGQGDGATD